MNFPAFLSYMVLTAITPGPNNVMAMSNAGKYGFKKGFPFNVGVFCGALIIITLSAVFTSLLYDVIPQIEPYMLCIGAAYILWLAWSIWRDQPHGEKKRVMQTNTVLSGTVLQFINVKVILYGITSMSTFILPYYKSFVAIALFVILMSFAGFASTCCWALFGAAFDVFFKKHKKVLNAILALMLVYCAVSQLVGLFY